MLMKSVNVSGASKQIEEVEQLSLTSFFIACNIVVIQTKEILKMFRPSKIIKETVQFDFPTSGNRTLLSHRIRNIHIEGVRIDSFDECFYIVYFSIINPALHNTQHQIARNLFLVELGNIVNKTIKGE